MATSVDEQGIIAQCSQDWKASADLRAEFGNDYSRYCAFKVAQAKGLVRILGKGGSDVRK